MASGKKYDYKNVKRSFHDRGYSLVSESYKNTKTDLEYICNKHRDKGKQKIKYANFLKGNGCVYCMYEQGRHIEYYPEDIVKEIVEKDNKYKYISIEYKNQSMYINFLCNNHVDFGMQQALFQNIKLGKNVCKLCNGTGRDTKQFKREILEIHPNIIVNGEYKDAKTKIKCTCSIHNCTWSPLPYNLLNGYGCPECGKEKIGKSKRLSKEKIENRLKTRTKYITFLNIPETTKDKVKCQCNICKNIWEASFYNLTKKKSPTSCPRCKMSNSEKEIMTLLNEWNLEYTMQKKFANCKDVFELPFDFYLYNNNTIIEYDGEYHYKLIPGRNTIEDLITMQNHDKIKTEYCNMNNINIIRIPYWERNNLEKYLYDKLVDLNILKIEKAC